MKQGKRSKKQNKRVKAASATRLAPVVEEEVTTLSSSDEPTPSSSPPESSSTLINTNTLPTTMGDDLLPVESTPSLPAQPSRPPLKNIAPNQSHRTTPTNNTQATTSVQKPSVLPPVSTNNTAVSATGEESVTEDPPADQVITTTQPMLEVVLGKVVEIVTEAEQNRTNLEIERLQQLVEFLDSSYSPDATEWSLKHTELQHMVLQVVMLAKESVRRGTPPPTGMVLQLQDGGSAVQLTWAPPHHVQVTTDGVVLGERLCI
jgi:hypothetical protein